MFVKARAGLIAIVLVLVLPASAHATFPGANGRIAFTDQIHTDPPYNGIYTINPDGSDERTVTEGTIFGDPEWSLDGTKIAYDRETTVNSLYPGAIAAGQRAVWEVGQVKAYDGGADGLASTTGDNTLFLTEGIFIP
jgi:hypothetical protein